MAVKASYEARDATDVEVQLAGLVEVRRRAEFEE